MGEAIYCVYKIANTVNDKIYIGITKDLLQRWYLHKLTALRGSSKNTLYQDMRAYGVDKFSIEAIEEGILSSDAYEREVFWIDHLSSVFPHGYNTDRGSLKRKRIKAAKESPWTLEGDLAPRPAVSKEQQG